MPRDGLFTVTQKSGNDDTETRVTGTDVPGDKRAEDVILREESLIDFTEQLKTSGGSNDMTVDGSSTPVNFTAGPTVAGEIWRLTHLSLVIESPVQVDPDDYGDITALTNGTLLIQDINGTEHTLNTLTNNIELIKQFINAGRLAGEDDGYLDAKGIYLGLYSFTRAVTLVADDGDQIIARVRDDLTAIARHNMSAIFQRSI